MVALQALRLCERRSPRPALLLETEQNILRRLPLPFERIRRHTLHHIDALVVRQPEALEVCRACGYEGPGVVVEYCVDRSIFHPNDRTGAKLEFEAEGFTIGYAGRLVPEKGLLRSWKPCIFANKMCNSSCSGKDPMKEHSATAYLNLTWNVAYGFYRPRHRRRSLV